MKVRCRALVNDSGKKVERISSLNLSEIYVVLSIEKVKFGQTFLRIVTNDKDPLNSLALFDSILFDEVTNYRPTRWRMREINSDVFISPEAWHNPGFWEDFYDGEKKAIEIFELERALILKEEP